MKYRFRDCELDAGRRELRRAEGPIEVQPLVLELLLYLVCHRDRVVTKDELLNALWADTLVTEASLSRAISLARRAIGDTDRADPLIRTHTRVGFRFVGEVKETASDPHPLSTADRSLPVRSSYARDGRTHIAYQVVGEGPVDVVVVHGWTLSMQSVWEEPAAAEFHRRLARRCRLILFDKRGTGLSDRVKDLPGLAQRMEDLTAVLDAVGSKGAFVIGISEGAPMAILFAASRPERVRGLSLIGGFARMMTDVDQPFGWTTEQSVALESYIRTRWGQGQSMIAALASRRDSEAALAWCARVEQTGTSPGAALELWSMNRTIDVRDVLPVLTTPCLVIHMDRDTVIDVEHGRHLARSIANARYLELEGEDHLPFYEPLATSAMDALEDWLDSRVSETPAERRLATVVAADLGSVAESVDPQRIHQLVVSHRGRVAATEDRKAVVIFDSPVLAVRWAMALRDLALSAGASFEAGLECGELELRAIERDRASGVLEPEVEIHGRAVGLARSIEGRARGDEVLISQALRDLVNGAGFATEHRNTLDVDGDPRPRALFATALDQAAARV